MNASSPCWPWKASRLIRGCSRFGKIHQSPSISRLICLALPRAWVDARTQCIRFHEADEPETCPCGHFPIIEICSIHNRITGRATEVGNICVKRPSIGDNASRAHALGNNRADSSHGSRAEACFHGGRSHELCQPVADHR